MSDIQMHYLKQMKRLKYKITLARILLFAGFITLMAGLSIAELASNCTARCRHCHFTLEQQNDICRIRTVSCAAEQPSKICPCAYDYRVARQ